MSIPLWCLLVGIQLPYLWGGVSAAYKKKEFGHVDNHHPRAQAAKLTGAGARAYAAQANAWEAIAVFTPAVLVAHLGNPSSTLAPWLALAWVAFRVAHGVAYIADQATLRSILFTFAALASLGLFFVGARIF